jgi:alkylation response protein AidB-like acyl-CoA dehydrogenase
MPLVLSEEQTQLRNATESFFAQKAPVSALRALRDTRDAEGFSRALWQEMVDLGWTGTFVPEQYGGMSCGFTELGVVLQASGRTLVASPLFSSIVLSASAILLGGTQEQKSALLPRLVSGELLVSVALQEGAHHNPALVATTASPQGAGYVINGCKRFVIDGHIADQLLVVARTAGNNTEKQGLSLFLVDSHQPGVGIERRHMVDSRNAADVQLLEVAVPESALVGELHGGYSLLSQVIDRGNIGLAAEMLGSLQAVFERTLDFLKQREQFGELIGTFQALQHRAAIMFCEIELSKSVVLKALQALDEEADNVPLLASLAKVQLAETFRLVSDEAIQMHGGMGMTDAQDVGFYLKRARMAAQMLGDENYHVQRYATLRGY